MNELVEALHMKKCNMNIQQKNEKEKKTGEASVALKSFREGYVVLYAIPNPFLLKNLKAKIFNI